MGRLDFILSIMKKRPANFKLLILFDGDGCVSKVAKQMGFDVRTLDILPLEHIDLQMDIMDFVPSMLNGWVPDGIWASPPCETWSIKTAVKGGGNRYWESYKGEDGHVAGIKPRTNFDIDKRLVGHKETIIAKRIEHRNFIDKTVAIINIYKKINPNFIWFIENPATGYLKYYLPGLISCIQNLTTYCKYGSMYRKETLIFSNLELQLKWCPVKYKGTVNDCHHTDNFSPRWDNKKQAEGTVFPKTYLERSSIPEKLCIDILSKAKDKFKTISV